MLINGRPADQIDALDRGLHYGDGLFETIAVVDGVATLWKRHMDRLREGCRRLGLTMPAEALLAKEAQGLCAGKQRAVLKVLLTRGVGGRGYRPPVEAEPNRILYVAPWPENPANYQDPGVTIRLCDMRLGENTALAGLKHLNRLEQVLARREWQDAEIAEGLMRDAGGAIIEGTMSNVFVVRDGALLTPDLSRCGVAGVVRRLVLDISETLAIETRMTRLTIEDVARADEVFLTNSLIGLWPVRRFEERCYTGAAGTVTGRIRDAMREQGVVC